MRSLVPFPLAPFAAVFIAQASEACDAEALAEAARARLPSVFFATKSFALDGGGQDALRIDETATLVAERDYRLILESSAAQTDVRITVRDPNGEVVAGNALGVAGADELTLRAPRDGDYQISFTFEPSASRRCAGAALGGTKDDSPRLPGEQRYYHQAWLSSLKPDGACAVSAHVLGGASFYGDRYVLRLTRAADASAWTLDVESHAEAVRSGAVRIDVGPLAREPFVFAAVAQGAGLALAGETSPIVEALKSGLEARVSFPSADETQGEAVFDLHGFSDAVAWCDELQAAPAAGGSSIASAKLDTSELDAIVAPDEEGTDAATPASLAEPADAPASAPSDAASSDKEAHDAETPDPAARGELPPQDATMDEPG